MTLSAEANASLSPSGLLLPDFNIVTAGRIYAVDRMAALFQVVREMAGAGIIMTPGQAELDHPEIQPFMRDYFMGRDAQAQDRFRMLRLAWDLTSDSFASRQLLFEMYNGGKLPDHKIWL